LGFLFVKVHFQSFGNHLITAVSESLKLTFTLLILNTRRICDKLFLRI